MENNPLLQRVMITEEIQQMGLFSFFGRTQHKKFKYYPRFYDEDREELLDRVRKAQGQQSDDIDDVKVRISKGFKNKGKGQNPPIRDFRRKQIRKSNRTFLYVLIALILITLVIFI